MAFIVPDQGEKSLTSISRCSPRSFGHNIICMTWFKECVLSADEESSKVNGYAGLGLQLAQ